MSQNVYRSEIRDSVIRNLLERVKKQNLNEYLLSLRLERIRQFTGAEIRFDFPVTALVGPNGGGKTTILLAAGALYKSTDPRVFFRKSRIGDSSMDDWLLEYELVCKALNPKGSLKESVSFKGNQWIRNDIYGRPVKHIGIARTLPASDNPLFILRNRLSIHGKLKSGQHTISEEPVGNIEHIKTEAERILGRSLKDFKLIEVTFETVRQNDERPRRKVDKREILEDGREIVSWKEVPARKKRQSIVAKQRIYIGGNGDISFSEFSFGAGEASVIHLVADIETIPDGSLVLIDEIENGLHPLAVFRLVDYLIVVAEKKKLQVIFTTHSDYALAPLPSEAIWASVDGRLQQGKLTIEVLRAVSGRIDRQLAIFVEDEFAKQWIEFIIRGCLADHFDEVGIYPLYGDGTAVSTHKAHAGNPSITFRSICILDGDSQQEVDEANGIFRLPGTMPELTVFNEVCSSLDKNIAILTVACQLPLEKQESLKKVAAEVAHTNRDPHLLFSQVGLKLGFVPEATVAGAFLNVWNSEHQGEVQRIANYIRTELSAEPKRRLGEKKSSRSVEEFSI